jgi:hypothetical protein
MILIFYYKFSIYIKVLRYIEKQLFIAVTFHELQTRFTNMGFIQLYVSSSQKLQTLDMSSLSSQTLKTSFPAFSMDSFRHSIFHISIFLNKLYWMPSSGDSSCWCSPSQLCPCRCSDMMGRQTKGFFRRTRTVGTPSKQA